MRLFSTECVFYLVAAAVVVVEMEEVAAVVAVAAAEIAGEVAPYYSQYCNINIYTNR